MGFFAKPHVFGSPVDSLREVFDMTQKQTAAITQLHEQGLSMAKIAEAVGIPLNTVKSWCRRHPLVTDKACLQCGTPVRMRPHRLSGCAPLVPPRCMRIPGSAPSAARRQNKKYG